jgi:hypothetical protein
MTNFKIGDHVNFLSWGVHKTGIITGITDFNNYDQNIYEVTDDEVNERYEHDKHQIYGGSLSLIKQQENTDYLVIWLSQ